MVSHHFFFLDRVKIYRDKNLKRVEKGGGKEGKEIDETFLADYVKKYKIL